LAEVQNKEPWYMGKKILGIVGYPLEHTFSPRYFREKFVKEGLTDWSYEVFSMGVLDQIRSLAELHPGLRGFNVTIPHKENIIAFLDELDEEAELVGAVNTVKIKDGIWTGYNTDVIGLREAMSDWLDNFLIRKVLILGSGGASKAAIRVMEKEDLLYRVVSRNGPLSYADLDERSIKQADCIINTTPLGMYPKTEEFPMIPYSCLSHKHFLFDMIYNPEKTIFLARGEEQGATIRNGLIMLKSQAEAAWKIWSR
jgi:shikimate dehydrogenase